MVSAEHGRGMDFSKSADRGGAWSEAGEQGRDAESRIRISLVGRPNVGKPRWGNALLESTRLIVSMLRTTRDSVELDLNMRKTGSGFVIVWRIRQVCVQSAR